MRVSLSWTLSSNFLSTAHLFLVIITATVILVAVVVVEGAEEESRAGVYVWRSGSEFLFGQAIPGEKCLSGSDQERALEEAQRNSKNDYVKQRKVKNVIFKICATWQGYYCDNTIKRCDCKSEDTTWEAEPSVSQGCHIMVGRPCGQVDPATNLAHACVHGAECMTSEEAQKMEQEQVSTVLEQYLSTTVNSVDNNTQTQHTLATGAGADTEVNLTMPVPVTSLASMPIPTSTSKVIVSTSAAELNSKGTEGARALEEKNVDRLANLENYNNNNTSNNSLSNSNVNDSAIAIAPKEGTSKTCVCVYPDGFRNCSKVKELPAEISDVASHNLFQPLLFLFAFSLHFCSNKLYFFIWLLNFDKI